MSFERVCTKVRPTSSDVLWRRLWHWLLEPDIGEDKEMAAELPLQGSQRPAERPREEDERRDQFY